MPEHPINSVFLEEIESGLASANSRFKTLVGEEGIKMGNSAF